MSTCESCKHWTSVADLDRPSWGPTLNVVAEDVALANETFGRCAVITLNDRYYVGESGPLADLPLAFTEDGSAYKADLWTQKGFGCVLHEPTTD